MSVNKQLVYPMAVSSFSIWNSAELRNLMLNNSRATVLIHTRNRVQFDAKYLLVTAPTCFGHRKWPTSGSYHDHFQETTMAIFRKLQRPSSGNYNGHLQETLMAIFRKLQWPSSESYKLLRRNWQLPELGHILWPKRVGRVNNKHCATSWKWRLVWRTP
jgi:hypothetical protein